MCTFCIATELQFQNFAIPHIWQASHSIFFNNAGIQYKISWKNRTIQDKNFQNTVQSWEIQDKNSENTTFAWKNENIQNINASYWKMTKNITV